MKLKINILIILNNNNNNKQVVEWLHQQLCCLSMTEIHIHDYSFNKYKQDFFWEKQKCKKIKSLQQLVLTEQIGASNNYM